MITPQQKSMVDEALRRKSQGLGSSAGFSPEQANTLNPDNPIAQGGTEQMTNPQIPSGGAGGFPTDEAQGQLKQEKTESQSILDTLAKRLKVLGERGQ